MVFDKMAQPQWIVAVNDESDEAVSDDEGIEAFHVSLFFLFHSPPLLFDIHPL